jgi:hypothetical protein
VELKMKSCTESKQETLEAEEKRINVDKIEQR